MLSKHRKAITGAYMVSMPVAACCSSQVWGSKVCCQCWLHNNARWVCGSSAYMLPIDWKWASVWSCTGCFDEASDRIWIAFNHQNGSSNSIQCKEMTANKSVLTSLNQLRTCVVGSMLLSNQSKKLKSFACEGINWKGMAVIRPGQLLRADTSVCQEALLLLRSTWTFCSLLCHLFVCVSLVLSRQRSPWNAQMETSSLCSRLLWVSTHAAWHLRGLTYNY